MIRAIWHSPWLLALSVAAVVVTLVGWVFPASRIVFNPSSVEIRDGHVALYRTFPGDALDLPRPRLSYVETIRPMTPGHNGGHPCTQAGGPWPYVSPDPVGTWSLDWAEACINDPMGFHWWASWVWHIGGLRLGPVSLEATVLHIRERGAP